MIIWCLSKKNQALFFYYYFFLIFKQCSQKYPQKEGEMKRWLLVLFFKNYSFGINSVSQKKDESKIFTE